MLQNSRNNRFRVIFLNQMTGIGNRNTSIGRDQFGQLLALIVRNTLIAFPQKHCNRTIHATVQALNFVRIFLIHLCNLAVECWLTNRPGPWGTVDFQRFVRKWMMPGRGNIHSISFGQLGLSLLGTYLTNEIRHRPKPALLCCRITAVDGAGHDELKT